MADIAQLLQNIMSAIYGEQVRGSIHDAIEAINDDVHDFVRDGMDESLTSTLLPAQGKAVGDAIAKTLTWKDAAAASSNNDLNELSEVGFYFLAANTQYVNAPESPSLNQRVVVVFRGGGNLRHQLYFNSATGVAGFRVSYSKDQSVWQAWQVFAMKSDIADTDSKSMKVRASIANNASLDALYMPGWYIVPMDYHVTGSPEANTTTGRRIVVVFTNDQAPSAGNYRVMMYFNHSSGLLAFRNYGHNTTPPAWRNWITLPTMADVTAIKDKVDNNALVFRDYNTEFLEKVAHLDEIVPGKEITYGEDIEQWQCWRNLDDMVNPGFYITGDSHKYINSPAGTEIVENDETVTTYSTGHRLIVVFANANRRSRHQLFYQNEGPILAFRTAWSDVWKAWRMLAPSAIPDKDTWMQKPDNTIFPYAGFTPLPYDSNVSNEGDKLRIMSYNVQRYNYGTETFIYDAPNKIVNFRKMLNELDADVVCTQESTPYVDQGYSKTSGNVGLPVHEYLYQPKYPWAYGHENTLDTQKTWNEIFSKVQLTNTGRVQLPDYNSGNQYRNIEYGVLTISSKKLLIMSIHTTWNDTINESTNGIDQAHIDRRASEYAVMMDWANNTNHCKLRDYNTGTNVECPAHTHTVICMDGNIATDDDRQNLTSIAANRSFILANGGAIGWVYTHVNASTHQWKSLDEVMVSDNVRIDNVIAKTSLYPDLYSDHCPLIADIVLL